METTDRNMPKGNAVFMVARRRAISMIPHKAPDQIEKMTAKNPKGYPNKRPISVTNLTSPNPIHFPHDTIKIIAKIPLKTKPVINRFQIAPL